MYKKIFTIIILISLAKSFAFSQCNQKLVTYCTSKVKEDATFIREYRARLTEKSTAEIPVARYSVLLTKGNTYRFNICSALDYEGEGVIQLFDEDQLVASTFHTESKTNFEGFEFSCNKTAIYKMYISFLEGKEGCAVTVLSLVK